MNGYRIAAVSVVALATFACSPQEPATNSDDTWVGTITTEGNVTTVINESGSVWGGTARLVEEASIGVEVGADEYMLGGVVGVAAHADRIYLVDDQVPALRAYDWNGGFLNNLGHAGEGPGEFRRPLSLGTDDEGRIWLHARRGVVIVFSPGGDLIAHNTVEGRRVSGGTSMVVTPDGYGHVMSFIFREAPVGGGVPPEMRVAMVPYSVDGTVGEPIYLQLVESLQVIQVRVSGGARFVIVPFSPATVGAFAPSRAVVRGDPVAYRFRLEHRDGSTTIIEQAWRPVPVDAEEAAAHRRGATRYLRGVDPSWTWGDEKIPDTKPAYNMFVPAVSGEVWVVRNGPASPISGCDEDTFEPSQQNTAPCWREQRIVDAFGADGRYIGEVAVPEELSFEPMPYIRGHDVIAVVEDEAGTIMVKRYRLVLAGGE